MYSSNAQPTGTNRPRACLIHTSPHHLTWAVTARQPRTLRSCIASTRQFPTNKPVGTPPHRGWTTRTEQRAWYTPSCTSTDGGVYRKSYGGHSERETPGPIPNPEVKPFSADGTAPGRLWESRTPPDIHSVEATARWPLRYLRPVSGRVRREVISRGRGTWQPAPRPWRRTPQRASSRR